MTPASVRTKTVLVADDTAFVRDRFRAALEQAGHRTCVAETATDLLAQVRAEAARIDLVILDLRLPEARGIDLVRSIRDVDDGRLPLVVFSGTIASADEVRELAELGVSGYVNEYSAIQNILPSLAPHLFPERFNRRGSPRIALSIPVQYRFGSVAAGLTLDLSHGGLALRTTSPLEASVKVHVRFRIPGRSRDVEADGRVAWSDTRVGMGIQFSGVEPTDQTAIDEFVDEQRFSNRKA